MAPPSHQSYHKDEKAFCFHHDILYEAKILDVRHQDPEDKKSPHEYLVHYKGWKNTWDDWVTQDRLRKLTDENRELALTLRREVEAANRVKVGNKPTAKKRKLDDSSRASEERGSSMPARGKRGRDLELEKEEQFLSHPSVRISIPDNLKSLLVDDWENISKNRLLVPLPAQYSANQILDMYLESEKKKTNLSENDLDVLEEVVAGLREYFDKCLGRILLYKFERGQYHTLRKKWESGHDGFADKGPGDVYGAEHLARLLVTLPELIAQTNLGIQATTRLREELTKFSMWFSKNSDQFFSTRYRLPSKQYSAASSAGGDDAPGKVAAETGRG
ncbi:histone acetylase complex subunit [Ascosphaera apis ARSEF 7405]|uniref:Chromatin modification-related protein EAF3 n=1 Tax=Ascosphaera apis ARSEF 7405 TaxID=392613 RepID=A0A168BA52_9EURO|nr:histone acetylase complex subunit [Ascosphaera apis ARSEF 7405]